MSFLAGGPECSTGANPLSQFQKHVQDDKSLQRDRLVGRGGMQEGMRRAMPGGTADAMMDDFLKQPQHLSGPQTPLAMEQMRREFESLNTGHRQSAGPGPHWAGEYDPGLDHSFAQKPGFDPREFERYMHSRGVAAPEAAASPALANGYQRPMGMGMGSMYGGGMYGMNGGMGMGYRNYNQPQQEPEVQGKGKGRMVELDEQDWERQFAELETQKEDVDAEANHAIDAEAEELDRGLADMDDDRWRSGELPEDWDNFSNEFANSGMRDPELGNYMFEDENIFDNVSDPFGEGVRIMDEGGNLSLAALAFEAAVKKDPSHVEAWTRLGAAQAQNEKETPAIRALEQALKLDPVNLDALMGLAVSYTNEGYDSTAYRTLERWLSIKYPDIVPAAPGVDPEDRWGPELSFTDREAQHKRVTERFIEAAQRSPTPETMDPDVQVGLGVLFYGAEEFSKAVDCFSAALASSEQGISNSNKANQRPLLWNRLGATLANSGRSEEAIEAYEKALELNPNFVRARYNLGVSCINIGCLDEAAQHLLGALAMHAVVEKEGREKAAEILGAAAPAATVRESEWDRMIKQNQSTNLYDTLRRVFTQMNRRDLADKIVNGVDVDVFRGEFDF